MSDTAQLYTGSIALSKLLELVKQVPVLSSMSRSETNGEAYVAIQIWVNKEPDQYGKHINIKLNPKKDTGESLKDYIGSATLRSTGPAPMTAEHAANNLPDDDDLPF